MVKDGAIFVNKVVKEQTCADLLISKRNAMK